MKKVYAFISSRTVLAVLVMLLCPVFVFASGNNTVPTILHLRVEFILFALVLIGVAIFHNKTFQVALTGLAVILLFKLMFDPHFEPLEHLLGHNSFLSQIMDKELREGEWGILLNLLGLLLGFAMLSKIFEESGVPDYLPRLLPDDWKGAFLLLFFVFILSTFLDNIAAALIGGTVALVVFKHRVHMGYLAAIVAASNAGGAGSVLGDTTTTMMWIAGVSPINVLHAFIASFAALLFFGWYAAHQQDHYQRIQKDPTRGYKIKWDNLFIVILILIGAIVTNFVYDMPALGVWIALLIGATFKKLPWGEVSAALKGTIFLLCLVSCASMMPVEELPPASFMTAFILGFVSAVFDNIPLTKLCIDQGHFDWGMLAYTVGFGGSMVWFGSSAGVAISNKFPHARNVGLWIRKGWHITFAYIIGFFVLYLIWGWEPADNKKHKVENCPVIDCPMSNQPEK